LTQTQISTVTILFGCVAAHHFVATTVLSTLYNVTQTQIPAVTIRVVSAAARHSAVANIEVLGISYNVTQTQNNVTLSPTDVVRHDADIHTTLSSRMVPMRHIFVHTLA
jgi:hypothetical protein